MLLSICKNYSMYSTLVIADLWSFKLIYIYIRFNSCLLYKIHICLLVLMPFFLCILTYFLPQKLFPTMINFITNHCTILIADCGEVHLNPKILLVCALVFLNESKMRTVSNLHIKWFSFYYLSIYCTVHVVWTMTQLCHFW